MTLFPQSSIRDVTVKFDRVSFFLSHNQTGQSPLMLAVSRGRMEMVEICLEAGADINAADEVRFEGSFLCFVLSRMSVNFVHKLHCIGSICY